MYRHSKYLFIIFTMMSINPVFTGYSWNDPRRQTWRQIQKDTIVQTTRRTNVAGGTVSSSTLDNEMMMALAMDGTTISSLPHFDKNQLSQITILEGQIAYLPCVVHNLGDRVVSWIRMKDLHILTSDIHQFTGDSRFQALHPLNSDSWTLRINQTRKSDTGSYECQVNTDPKLKFPVQLTVIDSDQLHDSPYIYSGTGRIHSNTLALYRARISGPREQSVREGSTITFTCEVSPMDANKQSNDDISNSFMPLSHQHHPTSATSVGAPVTGATGGTSLAVPLSSSAAGTLIYPPKMITHAPITWTHRGRLVSFQAARGGISLDTDYRDTISTSRLTIAMVTIHDTGDYTCTQGDAVPATVVLKIEENEHSEAMQRDMAAYANNGAKSFKKLSQILCFIPFLIHFCWLHLLIIT